VSDLQVGDRGLGATLNGPFAVRVLMPAKSVRPIPADLDFVAAAAALRVTYSTASHSLISGARADTALTQLVEARMRPHAGAAYRLDETAEALSEVAERKHAGKVVLRVAD
jgi:NADPH:quinone reductase-like Zn-dependent oxidoreductase